MSRRKKRGGDGPQLTGDEWIQTYSDTITLLLTFFILLYSFSSVDAQKFKQVATAMQSVLSGQAGDGIMNYSGDVPLVGETSQASGGSGAESKETYEKVNNFLDKNDLKSSVEVTQDSRGVILQLRDNVLFETGQADIKPESKTILEKINDLINKFPNNIIVEGHTDNIPIKNYKYESNWELSTERAVNVLRYFVQVKNQSPKRFAAAGYGEYRPIASNDSDSNRAKNRRVSILIVSMEKEKNKK